MPTGNTDKKYRWEWPADRTPGTRLLAKVLKLEKQSDGFLGIQKSPSIAANLPDAQILTGQLVEGKSGMANQLFTLVLPGVEAAGIAANDHVSLGLINNDVCICIAKMPNNLKPEQVKEWVENWQCQMK